MTIRTSEQQRAFDKDLFDGYENGKHRRYSLLFAVNGGAFAVARLLGDDAGAIERNRVAGKLSLTDLALGMIIFTAIMSFDILMFAWKIRRLWKLDHPGKGSIIWDGPFTVPGWIVLTTIWLLISAGWLLVAIGRSA
jgi:hypothetical protein